MSELDIVTSRDRHLSFPSLDTGCYVAILLSNMSPAGRLSIVSTSVLSAISDGARYGFDIIDRTGLPSGTVYPALSRLERDGYVTSVWEDERRAHANGRPARRYYRVTAPGVRALADAASHYRALLPAPGQGPAKGKA